MTTICYRSGTLASDSGVFHPERNLHEGATQKVFQLAGGLLYAGAGDADDRAVRALLDGVRSPDQLPSAKDLLATGCDINAVVIFPDGQVYTVACNAPDEEDDAGTWSAEIILLRAPYLALGSGREIALGALWAGKSAEQAVEAACEHNVWTRGPVQSLRLRAVEAKETKR
jgi:ATP-dependent HslUV protease subunit HslV